jgi:DNA-binding response OmpR family regulator
MNFIRIFIIDCYAKSKKMDIMKYGRQGQNTILVIEDDGDIRNFIARVLELEGYNVSKAGSAATAMEKLKQGPFDLVLLDLRLPDAHGWTILREMKLDAGLRTIPVVVLTAIAETQPRKKTLKLGADCYLVKPLSAGSLSQSVAGFLKKKSPRETSTPGKLSAVLAAGNCR